MTDYLIAASDIHTGSKDALMTPEWKISGGQYVKASKFQIALWKAWEGITDEWGHPDFLILNGDVIDGNQSRSNGTEVWTTDLIDQID